MPHIVYYFINSTDNETVTTSLWIISHVSIKISRENMKNFFFTETFVLRLLEVVKNLMILKQSTDLQMVSINIIILFLNLNPNLNNKEIFHLLVKSKFLYYYLFFLQNTDENIDMYTKYMLIFINFVQSSYSISNEFLKDNLIYDTLFRIIENTGNSKIEYIILKTIHHILFNSSCNQNSNKPIFKNLFKILMNKMPTSTQTDNLILYLQIIKNYIVLFDNNNKMNEFIDLFRLKDELEVILLREKINPQLEEYAKEVQRLLFINYNQYFINL